MHTAKHHVFVSRSLDGPVTDVPGIGVTYGGRLNEHGYFKASEVYAKYQEFGGKRELFIDWLQSVCNANSRYSEYCYNGLKEWEKNHHAEPLTLVRADSASVNQEKINHAAGTKQLSRPSGVLSNETEWSSNSDSLFKENILTHVKALKQQNGNLNTLVERQKHEIVNLKENHQQEVNSLRALINELTQDVQITKTKHLSDINKQAYLINELQQEVKFCQQQLAYNQNNTVTKLQKDIAELKQQQGASAERINTLVQVVNSKKLIAQENKPVQQQYRRAVTSQKTDFTGETGITSNASKPSKKCEACCWQWR